jgi:hypothetical protein
MTKSEVEALNRSELRSAAKKAGIKYGKLSLLQLREALVAHNPSKVVVKTKKEKGVARPGSKMLLAIQLVEKHPDWARKVAIQAFQDKIGLTKAGSATYWQLVNKKLNTK